MATGSVEIMTQERTIVKARNVLLKMNCGMGMGVWPRILNGMTPKQQKLSTINSAYLSPMENQKEKKA